ncbi:MAG: potassium transporter TrkG, partial [Bacilli bacterium]
MKMKLKPLQLSPARLLIVAFFTMLTVGTLLLLLPFSTVNGIGVIDAMFTTTSAITVTGLTSVDTGTTFTLFGQIVIIFLMQIGGLGYVTMAMLIFILLGRKMGVKQRILLQNSLNVTDIGGIIRLSKAIVLIALSVEFVGALLLATVWIPEFGFGKGSFFAIFHAVSAFNNAGFGLLPNNLINYVGNPIINFTVPAL